MQVRRLRLSVVLGLAALASTALAGCGDSGSSRKDSDTILLGTALPLSGQGLVTPEAEAGLRAAIDAVNADGGLNGHQLELKVCDTQFLPNSELTCTRDLIDAKVTAIMSPIISADQSGQEVELASRAGIPVIGTGGFTPAEFHTEGVYSASAGFPGWVYGAVDSLIAKGATKIGLLGMPDGAAAYALDLAKDALEARGMDPAAIATVDTSADPTVASSAAKAISNGVDGLFLFVNPKVLPNAISALKNAGYQGLESSVTAAVTPATIKALGQDANGILLTGQTAFASDTANPGVSDLLADFKKYQPDSDITENAIQSWSGVKLLVKLLSGGDEAPTSKDIIAAFDAVTDPIELGTIPPFGAPPAEALLKGYDNMYSPDVQNGVIEDGVAVSDGNGWINPFVAQ
jgi:branched-chain amino acid transport system substrate-binding protein